MPTTIVDTNVTNTIAPTMEKRLANNTNNNHHHHRLNAIQDDTFVGRLSLQKADDGAIIPVVRDDDHVDNDRSASSITMVVNGSSSSTTTANSNGHAAASADPYYRLSESERRSVAELRSRFRGNSDLDGDTIPARYDTDFTLYRWLKSADRTSRTSGNNIDLAEKLLRNHLRFRRVLKLDDESTKIPDWDENPMFARRLLPRGYLDYMPSSNKFLWWVDYSSIDIGGISNTVSSTDILIWHFWKYEHMLRVVMECERRTGAMSGVHMIMDVERYDMNPFSIMLTTNGGMTYFAQLIHYEQYPELTCPVNVINVAKWLMLPYRLIRSVMPKDFNERIRVSGWDYRQALSDEFPPQELPVPLGGANPRSSALETIPALKVDPDQYYNNRNRNNQDDQQQQQLTQLQIPARKRKFIPVDCAEGAKLKWWFRADAEVYFGVFYTTQQQSGGGGGGEKLLVSNNNVSSNKKVDILERMEMVHPHLRLIAKIVPESGELVCAKSGTYVIVFCNKAAWVTKRNVQVKIDIDQKPYHRRHVLERTYSCS